MIAFVGESRSETAERMGVRWEDGRLAAKQLFDAFAEHGVSATDFVFFNLFEHGAIKRVMSEKAKGTTIVAMGRKVQRELSRRGIVHTFMVHPAARGAIRLKQNYAAEVGRVLTAVGVL